MKGRYRRITGALGVLGVGLLLAVGSRSIPVLEAARRCSSGPASVRSWLDAALAKACEDRGERLAEQRKASASADYARALELWRSLGDRDRAAKTREDWATFEFGQERYETAQRLFEANRRYYESTGQGRLEVDSELWLAQCQMRQRSEGLAFELFTRASIRAGHLGYRLGLASAFGGRGLLLRQAGAIEQALDEYRRATELYAAEERPLEMAVSWAEQASCLMILGRMEEAEAALEAALEIQRRQNDLAGMAITLTQQGWYNWIDRQPEAALLRYEEALALQRKRRNAGAQVGILDRMGTALVDLGRWDEARSRYLEAVALAGEGSINLARTWSNLCRLGVVERRSADPENYCRRSVDLISRLNDPGGEAAAFHWAARQRLGEGDAVAAQPLAERSVEILEQLRLEVAAPNPRSAYFTERISYYQTLISVLAARHRQDPKGEYALRSFEAGEKMRARSLLDLLRNDLSPEDRQALRARLREEAEIRQQLGAIPLPERLAPERSPLETRREAVEAWLRAELGRPTRFSLAKELLALVDPKTVVLAYSLGEEESQLWMVESGRVELFRLPPRREIEPLAADYFKLISSPEAVWATDQLELVGGRLVNILLGQVASRLGDRRLVVVPDGLIAYLPFGSLPDPQRPGAVLLERREISFVPSLTLLEELRARPHPQATSFATLVVADPVYRTDDRRLGDRRSPALAGGWPRLEGTAREAEVLERHAPGPLETWTGFAARRDAFVSGGLDRFSLIHLATHGWIDGHNPEESALLLSGVDSNGAPLDGRLRVRDIFGLELQAELVVASACRTGLGGEARGEGMTSFTSGFLLAGSRRVVVSLWPIEDGTTALLMERFYEALLERRLAPADALRQAQLEIRRDSRTSAPFYWSAFVLQGDWRPLELPPRRD